MKKQIFTIALVACLLSIILPSCLVYRHDRDYRYERHHHRNYHHDRDYNYGYGRY